MYLLSRPEHAEQVLVSGQRNYMEAATYRPLRVLLGDCLLTSEGMTWAAGHADEPAAPRPGSRRSGASTGSNHAAPRGRGADAGREATGALTRARSRALGRRVVGLRQRAQDRPHGGWLLVGCWNV